MQCLTKIDWAHLDLTKQWKEEKWTTSHWGRVTSQEILESSRQAAMKKASWSSVTVIFCLTGNGPLSTTTQCGLSPEVHFLKWDQITTLIGEIAGMRAESLQSCPDPVQPYGRYPARLLCPWNCPGKNIAVSSHSLLWEMLPQEWIWVSHFVKGLFTV